MTANNLSTWLQHAARLLSPVSETPNLEAQLLLVQVLNQVRPWIMTHADQLLTENDEHQANTLLQRRLKGEPLPYILQHQEFYGLDFHVTPAVLIPRPETELLVELALARLPADRSLAIADLGTGSGAIALALAKERPHAQIVATDRSAATLAVARDNAIRLHIANVEFREGDWCTPLTGEHFDLIVSNPPYVATTDSRWREGELRFEPSGALVAGEDGLDAIRAIIIQAPDYLAPGGWLLLEHGYDQGEMVPALLRRRGFTEVTDHRDTAGVSRSSCGRWAG